MGRLDGKVAFITGAASGIGAASGLRFAQEGASLVGFDLEESSEGVEGDWAQAAKAAPAALFQTGDVRSQDDLAAAVGAAKQRFGRIDVLLNSAGVAGGGPVHMIPIEAWDRVVDINLKGTFLASRHVLPIMLEQESGSIINIASIEGVEAYNASKGAVMLLSRNMAMDYARKGIRVNTICPGFVETPLFESTFSVAGLEELRERIREATQLGRFAKPVEIANAALFLASDEASYVTGHALMVDGGYTAGHRFGIAKMMGLE